MGEPPRTKRIIVIPSSIFEEISAATSHDVPPLPSLPPPKITIVEKPPVEPPVEQCHVCIRKRKIIISEEVAKPVESLQLTDIKREIPKPILTISDFGITPVVRLPTEKKVVEQTKQVIVVLPVSDVTESMVYTPQQRALQFGLDFDITKVGEKRTGTSESVYRSETLSSIMAKYGIRVPGATSKEAKAKAIRDWYDQNYRGL